MNDTSAPETAAWLTWTPQERESFFSAIARHRASAWRVRMASRICALVLATIVAMLLSPLLYSLLAIGLSLVNFVVPLPDLMTSVMNAVSALTDDGSMVPLSRWFYLAALCALPGLVLMTLVFIASGRLIREVGEDTSYLGARSPNGAVLTEQRFANVVSEMSIAANLPAPRVLVAESPLVDAVVLGADDEHAVILVSTTLLSSLNRAELQAVAGHLVGAIANGDVAIGARLAATLTVFGLVGNLSASFGDPQVWKRFVRLIPAAVKKRGPHLGELLMAISNPYGHDESGTGARVPAAGQGGQPFTWREGIWIPFLGPVVIGGFFGGLVGGWVLGPLLSLLWRTRKYLADATAVRLTRDPTALADALQKTGAGSPGGAFAPWMMHMAVVHHTQRTEANFLSNSPVPMFPALARRLKALGRLGATVEVHERVRPLWASALLGALMLVVGGLMSLVLVLLVWVSTALSMLMTFLPFAALNALLRWMAR